MACSAQIPPEWVPVIVKSKPSWMISCRSMWYGNNSTIGSVRRAFNQNIDFQSCWFLESLRHHHQYYYYYYVNKQSSFLLRLWEGHVCIEHGNHLYLNFPHQHIRRIKQWKNFPSVDSFFSFSAIKIPPTRLVIGLARSFPGVSTHGTRRPRRRLEWLAVGIFLGKPDPQSSSVDLSIWTMVERLVTSKFATDHVRENSTAFLHLHTIFMTLVCCPNLSNNWWKKRLNFQRKGRIFVTLWLPELPLSEPKKTFLQNITSTTFQKK